MTTPLDLPALDKLHASYVKVTGTTADDMAKRYANLAAVEAIWDAFPALSARLRELEKERAAVRRLLGGYSGRDAIRQLLEKVRAIEPELANNAERLLLGDQ